MPAYPSIPFFSVDASRSGPVDAVIRTQMSAGPDKVRRRTTAAPKRFTGRTPFLTSAQLSTFETWFSGTIDDGALSFTADDPLDCASKTWRFVGGYNVARSGAKFQIIAELEIIP